jgi:hypothetical protein
MGGRGAFVGNPAISLETGSQTEKHGLILA